MLIRAWMRDPAILVQAEAPGGLAGLVFLDDHGAGAHAAAIVRRPGDPQDHASLWVAAGHDGCRRAYLRFLAEVHGARASEAELDGWDVDHLLERARAPLASTFVRVEAIPARANRPWGALFEAAAASERFFADRQRERRTMHWMICAKLAGKPPPRDPDDKAQLDHLVDFFASIGLDADEARAGLLDILHFVHGADRRAT